MKKVLTFITLFCFSFTAISSPISEIKSILPSFIPTTYAEGDGLPAVSDGLSEHEQDLVDYCMAETDKSEDECASEVKSETLLSDEATEVSQQTGNFLGIYDSQHATLMMIISAAVTIITTVTAFFFGGWKFASNYLNLAAACVIMIFFWIPLSKFNKVVEKAKKIEYGEENEKEVNQTQFIKDQITILKEARPIANDIKTALNVAIGITIATIVAGIVESVLCIVTAGAYCACNTPNLKSSPFENILTTIFPNQVHAGTKEELDAQKKSAKATVKNTNTKVSIGSWTKTITQVLFTVLIVIAGEDTATELIAWVVEEIFEKAGAFMAKLFAFIKVVFFSLDLKNFIKMKNMYKSADDEIGNRIELLKDYGAEIEQSLSSGSSSPNTPSTSDGAEGSEFDIPDQRNSSDRLGEGSCTSFNYKSGEAKESSCETAKTTFPKSKKPKNGGIKSLDAYMDALDPNPIFENISKAATTKEGIAAGEFSKNAKRLKKVIPKLLKMLKKKGIQFSKDQKAKNIKPLYLQVLEEGKKQDQYLARLTNEVFEKMNIPITQKKSIEMEEKPKGRKVFDDKKSTFKMPEVDMGDELEDDTVSTTDGDVDYGELNEYEDLTKDINKNKGASLWKIIKVRYKKSAWDDLLPKRKK
jgi:hypothetical protein